MKKILILLLFFGLFVNAQTVNEFVYRKIALNSCRCIEGSGVYFISLESIKSCDLLSIKALSDSEQIELNFDETSESSYQKIYDNLLSFRKDYCPSAVAFIENDKNEKAFLKALKERKESVLLEEQNRFTKEVKSTEEKQIILDNKKNETIETVKNTDVKTANNEDISIVGTFEKLNESVFNSIFIKDHSGQLVELMWLNKFTGSNIFTEGKLATGTPIKAVYKNFYFYNGIQKEYKKFKIIREFSLL